MSTKLNEKMRKPSFYVQTALKNFLDNLPDNYRYVFEFRNPSWFDEEIFRLLNHYRAAFCIYDLNQELSPKEITTDFIYIRLHGPDGAYKGQYSIQTLSGWAGAFSTRMVTLPSQG